MTDENPTLPADFASLSNTERAALIARLLAGPEEIEPPLDIEELAKMGHEELCAAVVAYERKVVDPRIAGYQRGAELLRYMASEAEEAGVDVTLTPACCREIADVIGSIG